MYLWGMKAVEIVVEIDGKPTIVPYGSKHISNTGL